MKCFTYKNGELMSGIRVDQLVVMESEYTRHVISLLRNDQLGVHVVRLPVSNKDIVIDVIDERSPRYYLTQLRDSSTPRMALIKLNNVYAVDVDLAQAGKAEFAVEHWADTKDYLVIVDQQGSVEFSDRATGRRYAFSNKNLQDANWGLIETPRIKQDKITYLCV